MTTLRICTYNIHKGFSQFNRRLAIHDLRDRLSAMTAVQRLQAEGELPTGLIYVNPDARNLHQQMKLPAGALNRLDEAALCPGAEALQRLNAGLR